MTNPSVCCVMLTADRQRFTDRAVACFLSQTHLEAQLLIYDTGNEAYRLPVMGRPMSHKRIVTVYNLSRPNRKIGALRNEAIDMVKADVIVTWDSDDWSAPDRIARQLADLEGHEATGYHNLLFLDTRFAPKDLKRSFGSGAWDYDYKRFQGYKPETPHAVGTSLVYWRDTWVKTPFSVTTTHEDPLFCKQVKVHAVNGIGLPGVDEPQLIAETHGGNISGSFYSSTDPGHLFDRHKTHVNPEWRRAPEWDNYARERLYP